MDESHVHDITRVIQLALAPAFLLTAIAGFLNVFSNRLARIVDRGRVLRARPAEGPDAAGTRREILDIERRGRLVRWAITLGTGAALLVSLVIGFAFLGFILRVNFARPVAALFVAAMAGLTLALGFNLAEITLAIAGMERSMPRVGPGSGDGGGADGGTR